MVGLLGWGRAGRWRFWFWGYLCIVFEVSCVFFLFRFIGVGVVRSFLFILGLGVGFVFFLKRWELFLLC